MTDFLLIAHLFSIATQDTISPPTFVESCFVLINFIPVTMHNRHPGLYIFIKFQKFNIFVSSFLSNQKLMQYLKLSANNQSCLKYYLNP